MKLSEILKASLITLKSNGRRTFLTMIGIIIGIAAVITILSLGNGFRKQTIDSLAKDEKGRVSQVFYYDGGYGDQEGTVRRKIEPFSEQNLLEISQMEGVDEAELDDGIKAEDEIIYGNIRNKTIKTPHAGKALVTTNYTMVNGRNLTEVDSQSKRRYIIISDMLAQELFPNLDPLHQTMEMDEAAYTIIGVFLPNHSMEQNNDPFAGMMETEQFVIPEGTRSRDISNDMLQFQLYVYFKEGADIKGISKKISQYLQDNGNGRENGTYSYFDTSEMMNEIGKTLSMITIFISSVAGISLFIAGVGVMNMMYISVAERTREIGIRRSLGATKQSIQLQFLLEGIAITTLGGILGYLLGIGLATVIGNFLPFKAVIEPDNALLSVTISTVIGIVFSVFPAKAAARKNVVDILRA